MRHEDWSKRMWAVLAAWERRPFSYGACVAMSAEVVDAITGSAWAKAIEALYASEADARALMAERGLEALIAERLGEPVARNLICTGGVALLDFPSTGQAAGICTGDRIACPGDRGLLYLPYRLALKGWRV